MYQNNGPVLAALSLDHESHEVLRQADAVARYYNVDLIVCHVLPEICAMRPLFPHLQLDDTLKFTELEAFIQERLAELIRQDTMRALPEVSVVIEQGTAHAGILRAAERIEAGMLVVGGKLEENGQRTMGRSAGIVLRDAHCPVLVARPSLEGKVLSATDFSDPSTPAVEAGVAEAIRRGVDLAIVHVVDTLPRFSSSVYDLFYSLPPMDFSFEMKRFWQEKLDECVTKYNAKAGGLLRQGSAAPAILEAAEKLPAQLVVVGSHGWSGLGRFALGSVAETIARKAPCSVLTVRLPG